ncbi:MAG: prepilin-type N-terminal cleavage/methylation domain-containing protein [Planctomycetota bacterium]
MVGARCAGPALALGARQPVQSPVAKGDSLWRAATAARSAFTLVELIVVVTVIVLVLAIGIPALSAMNAEARLTSAQQTIQGATTRAYYMALAERTMTAVRFYPAEWDAATKPGESQQGRQRVAVYRWVGSTVAPSGAALRLNEYFARAGELESVTLPEDVWVAPIEALAVNQYRPPNYGANFVLTGQIGVFGYDPPEPPNSDPQGVLWADDFLIVCDPQAGVRTGEPRKFPLRAYSPLDNYEVEPDPGQSGIRYNRYSAAGLVVYRREPFVALGSAAAGAQRQTLLRTSGRPYLVHRFSGGLLAGEPRPQ